MINYGEFESEICHRPVRPRNTLSRTERQPCMGVIVGHNPNSFYDSPYPDDRCTCSTSAGIPCTYCENVVYTCGACDWSSEELPAPEPPKPKDKKGRLIDVLLNLLTIKQ